jgi:hypothetical protein
MNVGPNVGTRTLEECEHVVNLSLLQTGGAFKEIRDRKLYRPVYGKLNFEQYCAHKWATPDAK